jgi:diaminopimelate epimerase
MFTIASASGNTFAYVWEDQAGPGFDGGEWAKHLCPRGSGLGLDGIFLLARPVAGEPWRLEHWDTDGGHTFCSNGSRGALAIPGAPIADTVAAISSGEHITLRRQPEGIAIRMPSGPGFGFTPSPLDLPLPHACAWIGNPQLVIEHADIPELDFPPFALPLRHHPGFPHGTNVSVLEILAPGSARIRSWERGVEGETLCCGTGCAVAGAWLTARTGQATWALQTLGSDTVTVTAELDANGAWRELWLCGRTRILGRFTPENGPAPQAKASTGRGTC